MSKIAEMRQKRGDLWDKAKAFLNEHADENGMIRQVNDTDLSRCDNRHMRPPIRLVHSGRMPAAAHPPSLPKCF